MATRSGTHRFPAQTGRTILRRIDAAAPATLISGDGPDASRRFRLPVAARADRRSSVRAARGRAPAAHPSTGRFRRPADRRSPGLLRPGDLLVCNDTKVIPARLVGKRGAATVEVTLHHDEGGGMWRAFAKGARRLHPGDRLDFAEDFAATVAEKHPEGDVTLHFDLDSDAFRAALARHGTMPLPPYIKRARGGDPRDRADYQTMFARAEGAVAAPTAGSAFHPGADRGADEARRRPGDPHPTCRPWNLSTGQDRLTRATIRCTANGACCRLRPQIASP